MAERSDLSTLWGLSPRLIEIAAPSTEIVIQDLHDTLKSNTEEASENDDSLDALDDDPLIDSAGKESLGGGVLVGITSTLLNAQVVFESRLTPTSTGTATAASSNNGGVITLQDTGATFVTDGVERGAVVINFTDESITEVLTVVDEQNLICRELRAGSGNDFGIGDSYKIWNIVQCDISGGNLVAVDAVDAELPPVFPSAFTQIVRTSSSSATLQELADIQYASFGGAVHVDLLSSFSGVTYPKGTPRQPVNNFADALTILQVRGFDEIHILGSATLDGTLNYENLKFLGQSKNLTVLTIPSGANVLNCEFEECTLIGTLDGNSLAKNCLISNVSFISGFMELCVLQGTIVLGGGTTAYLLDCYSGVPGGSTPTIDFGGTGQALAIRGYDGGIQLINKTGTDACSIDMNSGQVIVDDTVNNGTVVLRGVGKWTNRSTYAGNATIIDELLEGIQIREIWRDWGLDSANPKTITEIVERESYDEAAGADIQKEVRKVGSVTTITRQ